MNLMTFFEIFDTLAEAPGGIARLRELILDMAVRGKLVPQDTSEGSATNFLDDLTKYRKELVETHQIQKPKKLDSLEDRTIPYQLPAKWTWIQLGTVSRSVD